MTRAPRARNGARLVSRSSLIPRASSEIPQHRRLSRDTPPIRSSGRGRLAVPRLGPGALVAEPGSSLKAARSVGLIARARERLRCFAEHRTRLLALALSLTEDPPSFPHGAGPQATLPHARDALRFGDERARPIQLAGARAGHRRTRQVSHRARLARMHLAQLLLGPPQYGDGFLRIRGRLN